jgi:hypothetical protein
VKAIADTLEVSRSNLIERLAAERPKRGQYTKSADADLMPLIREIVDEKPTFGYRRVTARLNRQFRDAGQARVNHNASTAS